MVESNTPTVSVIMPVRNVENCVEQTVRSVLNQTFSDLELILVDDASSDHSLEVCNRLADSDPRIKVLRHEHNLGLGATRNTALDRARGTYVAFVDVGDLLTPNALDIFVDAATANAADVVRCSAYTRGDVSNDAIVTDSKPQNGLLPVERNRRFVECYSDQGMLTMTCLNFCRREFLELNRIRFSTVGAADEPFLVALLCLADRFLCISQPLCVRNVRPETVVDDNFARTFIAPLRSIISRTIEQLQDLISDLETPRTDTPTQDEPARREYVRDLYRDEIREGVVVDVARKKLWNAQIGLILEVDRICRKHDLKWFAYGGTLLGAARHKGFIPWDDDVDLAMLRPDYEVFKRVAPSELRAEYFLDIYYDYVPEDERNPEGLPTVERIGGYPNICKFLKVRDHRTTMLELPVHPAVEHGIWIDVFPFDPVPSFDDPQRQQHFEAARDILMTLNRPDLVIEAIRRGARTRVAHESLRQLLSLSYQQRALAYEKFMAEHWFESKYVARFDSFIVNGKRFELSWFSERVKLPFEEIEVWAPREFDELLKAYYGDWRTPVFGPRHTPFYSADIPYKTFNAKSAVVLPSNFQTAPTTPRVADTPEHQEYVKDLYRDEVRDGFFVDVARKKLWNAQIGLILEVDRICRKHGLKWFVAFGTLIGVARHKGFIPWDDDVDLAMLRPDYEVFKRVAPDELQSHYVIDAYYNYEFKGEPGEGFEHVNGWPYWCSFLKVRDRRTTMIEKRYNKNAQHGIFVDIFPFDPVPPFDDRQRHTNFEVAREIRLTIFRPDVIRQLIAKGQRLLIVPESLENLLAMPLNQRIQLYEHTQANNWFESKYVANFDWYTMRPYRMERAAFLDMIELPFEEIKVPAPRDYDSVLTAFYGDWRTPVFTHVHSTFHSTDISYDDYVKSVTRNPVRQDL